MTEKNNIDKYTGILFELKIGLNKDNAIVVDYGGKPVGKIREALKGYPYHGNLCAAVINHANSIGRKLENDIKQIIQKIQSYFSAKKKTPRVNSLCVSLLPAQGGSFWLPFFILY